MANKNWEYGEAYKRFPIEENEVMEVDNGKGIIKIHDLYKELPEFMLKADMVITDPPWNLSNVNTFYTKADKRGEHENSYEEFYVQLFKQIDAINPKIIYIEIGKQNAENFEEELRKRYPYVQKWDTTYYKTKPNVFLRASKVGETDFDYSGMDEWDAILKAIAIEDFECVADLCMGRGLVGRGAYENKKNFVGTELNGKRLSVLMEEIAKVGGQWRLRDK